MTKFTLDAFNGALTADTLAERLEFIAGQIRNGFTSGDGEGIGWWTAEDVKDDIFYQLDEDDTDDGLKIIDDVDPFKPCVTSWDVSDDGREFMEGIAERLNLGTLEVDSAQRAVDEELAQVRLRRLGYSWTDDWATGQQRWTLTGPDGAILLPSGGYHGWSEAVKVATADADAKALDRTPPA